MSLHGFFVSTSVCTSRKLLKDGRDLSLLIFAAGEHVRDDLESCVIANEPKEETRVTCIHTYKHTLFIAEANYIYN